MKMFAMIPALMMVLIFPALAHGAGYFGLSAHYESTQVEVNGSTAKSTEMTTDLSLGSVSPSGLYLGVIYAMTNQDTGGSSKLSAYGLSIGYMSGGFLLHAHYFLGGAYEPSSASKWSDLNGMGFDIAYLFKASGKFSVGGGLAIRNLASKKWTNSGAEVADSSLKRNTMQPRFIFAFDF